MLCDSVFAGSDTLATAYVLSRFFKKYDFDAIFTGRRSSDGDTGQTGICLAGLLGIPVFTDVMGVSFGDRGAEIKTRSGIQNTELPALFCFERTAELRFPSLFSRLGDVTLLSNAEIGADVNKCGLKGSPTRVVKTYERDAGRRKCVFIEKEEFFPLIERLKTEAKIKKAPEKSENNEKIPLVWAVGEEVYPLVSKFAEKCEIRKKEGPKVLIEQIKTEKPDAVFFPSDGYGKKCAATLQAALELGLCADVTELSVEDGVLYMFRPARGGSVYAKIKSLTSPPSPR